MVKTAIKNQETSQFTWKRKYRRITFPFAGKIPLIRELIINALPETVLKNIYLFGSYAYGNPTVNSDIDIFVVINNKYDNIEAALIIKIYFVKIG